MLPLPDLPLPLAALHALPSFLMALGLALYATPVAREAALRFGIVDSPDGRLKTHGAPVPYLGGLAVYGAFLVAMALSLTLGLDRKVLGILLGGSILVIVGLIDDLGSLPYGAKFVGEIVAALVAVRSGIVVQLRYLPEGFEGVELVLNAAVSILWLVLVTNAVNLVDIMDGLAGAVAAVAALFLMGIAVANGRLEVLCATAAMTGALLGFLRYNWHPATIYLGDTGALFVGFMLGSLCLIGSYTGGNPMGFLSPGYVLAVPLFDTAFVSVIRLARGRSPFRGSPDHFAIRLRERGWPVRRVVTAAGLAGAGCGAAGVLNLQLSSRLSLGLLALAAVLAGSVSAWLLRPASRSGAPA